MGESELVTSFGSPESLDDRNVSALGVMRGEAM